MGGFIADVTNNGLNTRIGGSNITLGQAGAVAALGAGGAALGAAGGGGALGAMGLPAGLQAGLGAVAGGVALNQAITGTGAVGELGNNLSNAIGNMGGGGGGRGGAAPVMGSGFDSSMTGINNVSDSAITGVSTAGIKGNSDAALNAALAANTVNSTRQSGIDATADASSDLLSRIAAESSSRSADQWSRFNNVYKPVEDQMVSDARNIDSATEQQRVAGLAAADVQAKFDTAQQQNARTRAAMGINPNSGSSQVADADAAIKLAAVKSSASTSAIQDLKDRGIALRSNVASFGNNTAARAAQLDSAAAGASTGAVGAKTAAMSTALAKDANLQAAYGTSIQGNTAAANLNLQKATDSANLNMDKFKTTGNLALGKYSADAGITAAQNSAAASSASGFGSLIGTLGAAAITKSSKKIKEKKKPVNDSDTLEKVKKGINVESWKYKDGVADSGEHIGAYAEDVHEQFGEKAAPGGKAIDMISMAGITLSAVKGLAKQVDKIESRVNRIATAGIKRTPAHA